MGRRGPQPEPTASRIARGITAPSRVNWESPVPRQRAPRPPRDMGDSAKAIWRHVMNEMPTGVILAADRDALRIYCEAMVRYVNAQLQLAGEPPLIMGRHGPVKNPLHQVVRDDADQVQRWARELGLTPSARAGLRIDAGAPTSSGIFGEIGLPPRLRSVPA